MWQVAQRVLLLRAIHQPHRRAPAAILDCARLRVRQLLRQRAEKSRALRSRRTRLFLRRHLAVLDAIEDLHPFREVVRIREVARQRRDVEATLLLIRIVAVRTVLLQIVPCRRSELRCCERQGDEWEAK